MYLVLLFNGTFQEYACYCHAGAMLFFSVSFQFLYIGCWSEHISYVPSVHYVLWENSVVASGCMKNNIHLFGWFVSIVFFLESIHVYWDLNASCFSLIPGSSSYADSFQAYEILRITLTLKMINMWNLDLKRNLTGITNLLEEVCVDL